MKRKLRLQFSLKGFLLLLTLACVILGNLAARIHRQRDAVDAMLRAGCEVTYDYNPDTSSLNGAIKITRVTRPPFWFDLVHSPTCVTVFHDADCAQALAQVRHLPTISDIEVYPTLKDDELALLQGWQRPRYLSLWGVADWHLAYLPDLDRLRILCLTDSDITDDSIPFLTRRTSLRYLSAFCTAFTESGLASLQSALPNCTIDWLPPREASNQVAH